MLLGINADGVDKSNENRQRSNILYGWGKYRPKCLQFLNNPKCFLGVVVVYSLCQAMAVLGLVTLVLPSIERRFSLSSKELGIIAGANDISALLLVVFVSFYGGYGNKIRWMGGGVILVGFGLILFSLPHFIVGPYKPIDVRSSGLCLLTNNTISQGPPECKAPSGGEWYYMMIFIVAQLIIGAGVSPFYSLFPVYLDENVDPKSMPVYLGIWYCFTFIGPGVGYFIGGKFLSIYVDIQQPPGQNLNPRNPSWIGAWWLGFLVVGVAVLLNSVVFLGFPREMPGAKERRLEHIRQGHIRDADGQETPRLRDILWELKNLLTNWTFTFNALALAVGLLYSASVFVFITKIFRSKFGVDPVITGYILSLLTITGVGLGNLCGALTTRMFSLKDTCKKAALMCFVSVVLASFGPLMFLLPGCMNSNLAGIAEPYHNVTVLSGQIPTIPSVNGLPLKSQCNINCGCSLKRFSPVCGSDSVTYVSACHAGCNIRLPNKTYTNCSCVARARTNPHTGGSAEPGYCDRNCKNVIIFAALASVNLILRFAQAVPGKTVILRCVPDNKRAFAVGMHYVILKTLGLLPGPIIFGHLVDLSCRLWQDSCGKKGRCFDYDIDGLSRTICFYGIAVTGVACFLYFLSWYFCKPSDKIGVSPTSTEAPSEKPGDSPSPREETCF